MKVSVLIVSHNTRELTLTCLTSLFKQAREISFEVIVVDNVSADGSPDAIADQFPQVQLVRSNRNLGFSAGNNLAARFVAGEYLLLLNPDTVVLDQAIEKLVGFAGANPQAAIFGGRTLFADGRLNPASCWRKPTLWSAFCVATGLTGLFPRSDLFACESYGSWQRDSVREVDIVSGCFLLIRRKVWDELGGFDESFFMYGEETDLCLRARKLGHTCMICPDATIIHHGGASEKVRADKMVKLFVAKAQLFNKHWRPRSAWFGVRMLDLWAITRVVGHAALATFRSSSRTSLATWREVWRRRGEWRGVRRAGSSGILPPISEPTADGVTL